LAASRLRKVVVLHANHANEFSEAVEVALLRLSEVGCHLLNQSVLLAGVNNNADTLVALSHRLFACGVLPYYLHLLDKVQGAAHFDVSLQEAKVLFKQIQEVLPGYLVPRLVREEAQAPHKTLIESLLTSQGT
jgi:L-lysine 2,3-aminomutase